MCNIWNDSCFALSLLLVCYVPTVPVSGPVRMHYEYDTGENYAVTGLRFYCKAAEGSHPHFQWYINATPLSGQGNFYSIFNQLPEQSILLLSVGRSSAGTYHCKVSDSFDNTSAICSIRLYLDEDGNLLDWLLK